MFVIKEEPNLYDYEDSEGRHPHHSLQSKEHQQVEHRHEISSLPNIPDQSFETPMWHSEETREDLISFLNRDTEGKIVLFTYQRTKQLPNNIKNVLVRKLMAREADIILSKANLKPGQQLRKFELGRERFIALAQEIQAVFNEKAGIYFTPYCKVGNVKINASGKLWDRFNNVKKMLRDSGILARNTHEEEEIPVTTICETEIRITDDEEQKMIWLRDNDDPWDKVVSYWYTTFSARRERFLNEDTGTQHKYFEYKCLVHDLGADLIRYDFEKLYPGRGALLFQKWDAMRQCIQDLATEAKITDVEAKLLLHQLPNLSKENQDAALIMLLTYIIKPTQLTYNPPFKRRKVSHNLDDIEDKKAEKNKRASQAEAREVFILQVISVADIEPALERKRQELHAKGLSLQPLIVFVGPVTDIQAIYVAVDNIRYKVRSPLHAIDLTFKIFFTSECEYPQQAFQIWLFIQKAVYEITFPGEKYGMQLNTLFGSVEKILNVKLD